MWSGISSALGHYYNLYINGVCCQVFSCIIRGSITFTVWFVVLSVSDCLIHVDILCTDTKWRFWAINWCILTNMTSGGIVLCIFFFFLTHADGFVCVPQAAYALTKDLLLECLWSYVCLTCTALIDRACISLFAYMRVHFKRYLWAWGLCIEWPWSKEFIW